MIASNRLTRFTITIAGIHRLTFVACLSFLLAACSTLPDYARPKILSADQLQMKDVIAYRSLQRSDFKGEQPPPGFDHRMGAAICAYFDNNIEADSFEFEYRGMEDYRHVYEVTLKNPRIWALMDRDCSWWNPGIDEEMYEYVLEHEEVHFALFEITARKWSAQLEATLFLISGSDESELKQDLQAQFETFWERGKQELDARNLEFDKQTSAVFDPERQKQWLATVRDELSAVSAASPARDREVDARTREAPDRAREALKIDDEGPGSTSAIEEAGAAALPPDCDPVRAGMLAVRDYRLARQ
jgi:hypothetical protein